MQMYRKLALALVVSYVTMFILSMSMIRQWDHFYVNGSNAYMALIMVAPMGVIMLLVMWKMYENKKLNVLLTSGFALLFVAALLLGRNEVGIGNEEFLKSMIPHHSRAILVCQEADVTDPEIERLCGEIVQAQRQEIEQMQTILERY